MEIQFNAMFKYLSERYVCTDVLESTILIPDELQLLLQDQILFSDDRIEVPPFGYISLNLDGHDNISHNEDSNNHFHIKSFVDERSEDAVFKISVQMLKLLAQKFEHAGMTSIRCWLSFSSREMSKQWAINNNLHTNGDEYFINERLSFFLRRENEAIIEVDEVDRTEAILIIDI